MATPMADSEGEAITGSSAMASPSSSSSCSPSGALSQAPADLVFVLPCHRSTALPVAELCRAGQDNIGCHGLYTRLGSDGNGGDGIAPRHAVGDIGNVVVERECFGGSIGGFGSCEFRDLLHAGDGHHIGNTDRHHGYGDGHIIINGNNYINGGAHADGDGDVDVDGGRDRDGNGDGHDNDDDDDDLISASGPCRTTFVEYSLCKHLRPLQLPPHPDPIVETSSLASVPPPAPSSSSSFEPIVGSELVVSSKLSCLQIEAIFYALQRHSYVLTSGYRAGFFLGDGAGVGKGRTIAGLVLANWKQGRKRALWVSIGSDLRHDARRDLDDVGAKDIPLHPLNKLGYGKLDSHRLRVRHGVLFLTYSSLVAQRRNQEKASSASTSRLQQVLQWCGQDFDGLILFDECHRAKNLSAREDKSSSSRTAIAVRELQLQLPFARVVYCSATGVSELRNLGYMLRLGLWGQGTGFHHFWDFLQALNRGGVGAQELLAMEMKARGMYLSRNLSFDGAEFDVVQVELDPGMVSRYNQATEFWKKLHAELTFAERNMHEEEQSIAVTILTGLKKKSSKWKMLWRYYWGIHQRFFRNMCMSAKISAVAEMTKRGLEEGKCVVIGLQSTGEACTEEVIKERGSEELDDFVSSPKEMLIRLVRRYFPVPDNVKMITEADSAEEESWEEPRRGREKSTQKRMIETPKSHSTIPQKSQKTSSGDSHPRHSSTVSALGVSSRGRIRKYAREPIDASCNVLVISSDSDSDSEKKTQNNDSSDWTLPDEEHPSSESSIQTANHIAGHEVCVISDDEDDDDASAPVKIDELMGTIHASLLEKGRELLAEIEKLELPKNPLDELIDKLGGPEHVAEMTGRTKTLVRSEDRRSFCYTSRGGGNTGGNSVNMHEKQQFMDGKKLVAIISEASSVGISLQADRRVLNQRRRVHIVLELPWSAEKAIQQFGRSHRSNQSSAPEYKLLFTNLGGERRFASIVAKRLETLGALTQGDRRAGPSLSAYNYHSVYGHKALTQMYNAIMGKRNSSVLPPGCENSHDEEEFYLMAWDLLKSVDIIHDNPHRPAAHAFCAIAPTPFRNKPEPDLFESTKERDQMQEVGRFLNRSLGLAVSSQNILFDFFMKLMEKVVSDARREGLFDSGIVEIRARSIELLDEPEVIFKDTLSSARTELFCLRIDRGLSWEAADELLEQSVAGNGTDGDLRFKDNGFYELKNQAFSRKFYLLAIERPASSPRKFRVFRPNSGGSVVSMMGYQELMSKYRKCQSLEAAREAWVEFFNQSIIQCTHGVSCKAGPSCPVGKRIEEIRVLGGLVLPIWKAIEMTLKREKVLDRFRAKVVRLQTSDSYRRRIVGIQIPSSAIEELRHQLNKLKAENTSSCK